VFRLCDYKGFSGCKIAGLSLIHILKAFYTVYLRFNLIFVLFFVLVAEITSLSQKIQ